MKILFLTQGNYIDYQNDSLLIGLKELFGSDVVDHNKQEYSYNTYEPAKLIAHYGKGMTVTRILPDLNTDRTDIFNKIKNKYFDYIVYGSIWRYTQYIDTVLDTYPKNKIVVVDGEDHGSLNYAFYKKVLYFKRELSEAPQNDLFPINFSIPTCKLNFNQEKTRYFSYITPLNRNTYVYSTEKDYYSDYGQSKFGITIKKFGWDCMRHYEILANGCIPLFLDIKECPKYMLASFPKDLCTEVLNEIGHIPISDGKVNSLDSNFEKVLQTVYDKYSYRFMNYTAKNLTTLALAERFINTLKNAE